MSKIKLQAEKLAVESFMTSAGAAIIGTTIDVGGGCVCDVDPCACTRAHDCTGGSH